jgi:hypothetical protein
VQALRDPWCVLGRALPPVYCVSASARCSAARTAVQRGTYGCLAWLDARPEHSVVFLCFVDLDKSGHPFLWVICAPDGNEEHDGFLDALLTKGFLQRTQGRGLVVRSWAPQADILQHPYTGAFTTHCVWNSSATCAAAATDGAGFGFGGVPPAGVRGGEGALCRCSTSRCRSVSVCRSSA